MKTDDLSYINGFLQAMSLVNVGTNHGCWYSMEPVERSGSLEESLHAHFAELFKQIELRHGTQDVRIAIEALKDWKGSLMEVTHRWFFETECSPSLKADYQPSFVTKDFVERLEKAFASRVSAWVVEGGSDDIESTDILFEDSDGYYLMRFGWCD